MEANNDTTEQEPMNGGMHMHALKFGVLAVIAVFSVLVVGLDYVAPPESAQSVIAESPLRNPFEDISLEATAAYVIDTTNAIVLFSKNEEQQLPLASLTKIMTALVASDVVPEHTTVTIDHHAIAKEGDSGLNEGDRWQFKDLLDFTLIVSSNDGADALASATESIKPGDFTSYMNERAAQYGLVQSYFINESGLDIGTSVSGGYGSARDMAHLFAYTLSKKPDLLEATAYPEVEFVSENNHVYNATNTNPAVSTIPGLMASKTGFTDLAGGNLAIAFDVGINHPVVAVVLGSSYEGRFADMEKLVNASLTTIAQ